MIKTLYMIGVVAITLACLLYAFADVQGAQNGLRVAEFLDSQSIVAQFKEKQCNRARAVGDLTSPLVQQAEAFALHLNPTPAAPKSVPAYKKQYTPSKPQPIEPQFKVCGTSFCKSNPEMSLALIDEPGNKRRWLRQASKVGAFLIEQIKDGTVIVKSNEMTFELAIEKRLETNPLQRAFPVPAKAFDRSHMRASLSLSRRVLAGGGGPSEISAPTQYSVLEPMAGENELGARVPDHAYPAK